MFLVEKHFCNVLGDADFYFVLLTSDVKMQMSQKLVEYNWRYQQGQIHSRKGP